MTSHLTEIRHNATRLLKELPTHVTLVAAAKGRTVEEVQAAIDGGITHFGHNYIQEAEAMIPQITAEVEWHMIGHLQRNKVNKALRLFQLIETLDSARLAEALERRCAALGQLIPVLIEVNSGEESNKTGVLPDEVDDLAEFVSGLAHLRLLGLMTMGPRFGDPEKARPYFRATRQAFERLAARGLPGVEMRYLSMGMSNSYPVAIEEGANVVRLGTILFGPRPV